MSAAANEARLIQEFQTHGALDLDPIWRRLHELTPVVTIHARRSVPKKHTRIAIVYANTLGNPRAPPPQIVIVILRTLRMRVITPPNFRATELRVYLWHSQAIEIQSYKYS